MIIAFCGHSQYYPNRKKEASLLALLAEKVGDQPAKMYLGNCGAFDRFVHTCCRKCQKTHPNVSLVFVTPYMTLSYQKNHLSYEQQNFDEILYPVPENKPLKFAISHRNRFMMEQADLVVAYITHALGGAYAAYQHAKRKGKEIINLAELS